MTIDRVNDILDKWEFFYGQRAGRELWADKPTETQNEDIANFCRDLGLVREALERTRWIPCSERLPDMPGDYQVCTKNEFYGTKNVSKRYFNGDYWSGRWTNITHWMPLPEPPEEEQNGRT